MIENAINYSLGNSYLLPLYILSLWAPVIIDLALFFIYGCIKQLIFVYCGYIKILKAVSLLSVWLRLPWQRLLTYNQLLILLMMQVQVSVVLLTLLIDLTCCSNERGGVNVHDEFHPQKDPLLQVPHLPTVDSALQHHSLFRIWTSIGRSCNRYSAPDHTIQHTYIHIPYT